MFRGLRPRSNTASTRADQFLALMAVDKKVLAGQLRLILLKQIGAAQVVADLPLTPLKTLLTPTG